MIEQPVARDDRPCIVCHVPFAREVERSTAVGDYATALMTPDGRILGWAHTMCAVAHHSTVYPDVMEARCANCGGLLYGAHGVTTGSAYCTDGSGRRFALARGGEPAPAPGPETH